MNIKKIGLLLLALALILVFNQSALANSSRQGPAPLLGADSVSAIPGRYIVVLNNDVSADKVNELIERISNRPGVKIHYSYNSALKGYAADLPTAVLDMVRADRLVSFVEADQVYQIDTTQSPVTWGLDRTDQRNLPLSNSYTYNSTGAGVTAYVIDTGIRITHTDFGGRASVGTDTIGDGQNGIDCAGHGTHVAGTIGGATYGIAKGVTLIAVRVLNCSGSGTTSGVIAGVDWVTSNHQSGQPAVANMSLGGSASTSLDNAVKNSIADGVVYTLSAGNSGVNACRQSPARVSEGITVGATDSTDTRPSWSNFGNCLDLFAPGVNITSDYYTSDTATVVYSGTSMAAPHVAGVAVLYLQNNPSASPSTVRNALVNNATSGVVKQAGNKSPNKLLFSNY